MPEHEEEPSSLKVKDRRKFNLDGSIREGYEPETETAPSAPVTPPPSIEVKAEAESIGASEAQQEELPGAENPSSFINFLSTLATNAAVALGMMAHPSTGKPNPDLDSAKYWIDVLTMLREKTSGNLLPQETKIIDELLADFRMQYVQLVRAYEARLKKQAAGKIGLNDLLGKK